MIRILTLSVALLALGVLAHANTLYGYDIDGTAAGGCNFGLSVYGLAGVDTTDAGVSDSVQSAGTCTGSSGMALAMSGVNVNLQLISGTATVTNGVDASADASYYDTVTVFPLPGTNTSSVTVGVAST